MTYDVIIIGGGIIGCAITPYNPLSPFKLSSIDSPIGLRYKYTMSYYKVLGLEREPFSTSPDPAFFYLSHEHKAALYRLIISIKLKRGLGLILGDVGTGKTTLSRRVAQYFKHEGNVIFHLMLNPIYETPQQFLLALLKLFQIEPPEAAASAELIGAMERYLFQKGVEEQRTVVLLIDEAQKLDAEQLEILRVLLNYETNEFKILQLVLVSQMELLPRLGAIKNFWDRIALKYVINPLDEDETKAMIAFRLSQAGYRAATPLFTPEAIRAIYAATQGYPRKIAMLCHDALELVLMRQQPVIDGELIQHIAGQEEKLLSLR